MRKNNKFTIKRTLITKVLAFVGILAFTACNFEFELPEEGSIEDLTPPSAAFEASQNVDNFRLYNFANLSTSATQYQWDFGDGNTSTDKDGVNEFPGEGNFTVTLTVSDALGVESTVSQTIEVVEPEAPAIADPVLVNADFNKLPKSSGSDCACSAWINKDLGDQGESSSGNGGSDNVVKLDNNEPDHVYQEFEVTPNADYTIELVASFKELSGGSFPSMLDVRVLSGTGFVSGYTPIYFTETTDFPQENWGYTSIAQVEDDTNNLLSETISNPDDDSYITYTFTFNSGANNSVALFIRGIGGPATGGGGGDFGYNSGDEEIRLDSVIITAINL
ncbi:PKD domain-containing protein [uncultured Tenacibaculum sp.]|uniref:PKD domain-containing protein n=1 Tax=uncultured Tenacibaculum sp. TaxID=174713 RepID=UPI0026342927|nr:PKD domain-containing protein [uncultured Tenacibaculum sp.]